MGKGSNNLKKPYQFGNPAPQNHVQIRLDQNSEAK
jgi:hypothetical protein